MPTKKITVDPVKLEAEIDVLNKAMEEYRGFAESVISGLGAMMKGMDPVLQYNIGGKMNSAMRTLNACGMTLTALIQALRNCKETYQSVDAYLAKEYADWLPEEVRDQYSSDSNTDQPEETSNTQRPDFNTLPIENPGYSGPCNMAAIANMVNRRYLLDGKNGHVSWQEIQSINGGESAHWTGNLKNGIQEQYGYSMIYESSANMHNIDYIKDLCASHPEGILVYSQGTYPHGVVLSVVDNEFMLTDSSGGTYSRYEESWMATGNGLPTVEDLLSHAYNIYYIQ